MSNSVNNNDNNAAANFVAKMRADVKIAEDLIADLKDVAGNIEKLKELLSNPAALALYEAMTGKTTQQLQAVLDEQIARQTEDENKLKALDPGFSSLCNAINALEAGVGTVSRDVGGFSNEDLNMFNSYLDKICDALREEVIVAIEREKMNQGGGDDKSLMQDAIAAMRASGQEGAILASLQNEMAADVKKLNTEKNDANNWLSGHGGFWSNALDATVTGSGEKENKEGDVRNSDDMINLIRQVLTDIVPEIAVTQNAVYDNASLELQKIIEKIEKLLQDPTLNNGQKADQIKYLMGLALGILSMIQTDAAKEKAKNAMSMTDGAIDASSMNLENSKWQLREFDNALHQAATMGLVMRVVTPILAVASCLLAPGVGSLLIMGALAISATVASATNRKGLTDMLTDALAKTKLGNIGAQAVVALLELTLVMGGGVLLDKALESTVKAATKEALVAANTAMTEIIDEATAKALSQANKIGDKVAEAAVRKEAAKAVTQAAETAVEKTVVLASRRTVLEGLFKGTEESCAEAAENAARITAGKMESLLEVVASGVPISGAAVEAITEDSANIAVGEVTNLTAEEVGSATSFSPMSANASRGLYTAAYIALQDNLLSAGVEAALKAEGHTGKDKLNQVMDIIKVIEQMLMALTAALGTGVASNAKSAIMDNTSTTILKAASWMQVVGIGAEGVADAGQAEATMEQSDAVAALSEISTSNEILQNLLQEFSQQRDIDRKHLETQAAEAASNYTLMMHIDDNLDALVRTLAAQAV